MGVQQQAVLCGVVLALAVQPALRAHDDEARYVADLDWSADQITRAVSTGHALGLRGNRTVKFVDFRGRRCIEADLVAFDVADEFAFDVDETIELEVVFAAGSRVTMFLAYDRNGTAHAVSRRAAAWDPQRGEARAVLTLERARFANRGEHGTDLAIAATQREPRRHPRPAAICEVRLRRGEPRPPAPFGGIDLRLTEAATGEPEAARVGLYDETGRLALPSGSSALVPWFDEPTRLLALREDAFWPHPNRWVFYVDGTYRARVPAGRYLLVATRGPEYRVLEQRLEISAGRTSRVEAVFERWADMPARGWYSGDTHIHARRRGDIEDQRMLAMIRAEDLWVGSTLQSGNIRRTYFDQRWGDEGRLRERGRYLVPGQEDPRTGRRGHGLMLNLRRPVRDPERYFLFHETAAEVRAQGGLAGYGHVHRGWFGVFSGLALDVPFGVVDFVEVLQGARRRSPLGTDGWYRSLNLGFKLAPSAGSDFPYLDPPGEVRSYVRLDGELTAAAWYEGLRAGRTFVTNGPLLELDVAGHGMGSELRLQRGARVRVRARADLNPDLGRLDALLLVAHGEEVARVEAPAAGGSLEIDRELAVEESLWLAAVATGRRRGGEALAHSAPVYLIVDDAPFWKPAEVPQIVRWQLGQLAHLDDEKVDPHTYPEYWQDWQTEAAEWVRQRPLLDQRVEQARKRYQELLQRAAEQGARSP